jgi:hypothetical protein
MAGADTWNGALSVVTEQTPCDSRRKISRRVGSDKAPKIPSSESGADAGGVRHLHDVPL